MAEPTQPAMNSATESAPEMPPQTQMEAPMSNQPMSAPSMSAETQMPAPAQPPVDPNDTFFAALGYFGPLFIVPLIARPKSAFCKFHARQSMVLFLLFVVFSVLLFINSLIGSLLTLPLFAVYVLAIYKAYKGEIWRIPLVSAYADKIDLQGLYGKAGKAVEALGSFQEKKAEAQDAASGQTPMKDDGESKPSADSDEQTPLPPAQSA